MITYIIIFSYYLFICAGLFYFVKKSLSKRAGRGFFITENSSTKKNFMVALNSFLNKLSNPFIKFFSNNYRQKNSDFLEIFASEKNIKINFNIFVGYKILMMFLFATAGVFISENIIISILLIISGAISGFLIPDLLLKRFNIRRLEELNSDLPYVIDLLYISTLSGQNIYNSIKIIIEKYKGNIGIELKKFLKDIDFGIGKLEAFRNFISRNNTEDFKNLLFLLLQAEKYGSSISEVLKQKSKQIKFEVNQNFDRKSRRVSVLMIFPLVFLILPAFVLLVGGPLIFSIGGNIIFS
jgi:pilus assembly protein TadC